MNYFIQLDTSAAQKVGSSGKIDGDVSTIAKVTQAYYTVNQKGTQTLHLSLETEQGEQGDFAIHFANGQGERLVGYNLVNAIIALTGLQGITQTNGKYLEFDFDAGRKVEKQGYVAPELIGKKFGIITTKSYSITRDQQGNVVERYRVEIYSVYHAQTMQWARQVINNEQSKPGQVDQMLEQAKKVSVKNREKPYNPDNLSLNATQGYQQPMQQQQGQRYATHANGAPVFPPQPLPNGYVTQPAQAVSNDDIPF
ncbi:hypothetical protein [Moraxella porci]|uniref:hypothetical protein n=1 Tax=Moraxella porci TaxID=1288392 RepID=UPI0024472E1B|nr:hypothetical protein [Moraxella porci]MDH2272964.1 hypothetical protein [Moraxella porci]